MSASPATDVNYWPKAKCAKAFWSQSHYPPYHELLRDTAAWLDPLPGQHWLDLGCGSGPLTRAVWDKSGGKIAEIVSLDCAAVNEETITRIAGDSGRVRFIHADFSGGLATFADGHFDGVVSGLAIQYAESWDAVRGAWTTDAYDHLLAEVLRVLRPGGAFVFSVNVPEPAWYKVALRGWTALFRAPRPLRYAKNAYRMLRYGSWLKREARRGRFHYLPIHVIVDKLSATGFTGIEHRTSYAGQAFVIRCRRP